MQPSPGSSKPGRVPTQAVDPARIPPAPDAEADAPHARAAQPAVGISQREYGHSSEDRNTMRREGDFPSLDGGVQPRASTDARVGPGVRPRPLPDASQ